MHVDYASVDRKQLAKDIDELRKKVKEPTQEDFQHLKKVELWGRLCAIFGYATAWIIPFNPISAFFISTANMSRWANVTHPVMHGAYDKVPNVPKRYTRKGYARGWRRIIDWLDWIQPEAWDIEHNNLHHYRLGEKEDQDLIEQNMEWLRHSKIPMWARYTIVILFMGIWKAAYYAPTTLHVLNNIKRKKAGLPETDETARNPFSKDGTALWLNCYLPYVFFRFAFLPMLFLPFGVEAATNVLLTSLLAELFTNIHSFTVIVPNHSAEDIYRFNQPATSKGEFYLRQIIGSVNYTSGSDLIDFSHGWLNYQIEHHIFPFLPLSQYQKMRPEIQKICEKHNLPYRQENVFKRLRMSMDLMVGKTRLLVADPEPTVTAN
ncbi:MAG: fatty acid desaturase [Cycloclasticus sp. symbiont of Bathymodiolus heckerae]|nr:MAG: fatty acid desaturase [Cycloclasticus sp. symbiont of Bathymodiolus heckerae]